MAALIGLAAWLGVALAMASPPAGPVAHEPVEPTAAHGGPGVEHTTAAHGGHEGHGLGAVNWVNGVLGEQGGLLCGPLGAEPGDPETVLCRAPGAPVPVGVMALNTGVLFLLFWYYGRKPLRDGLRRRREGIQRGITEATRMRKDAEARLLEYEDKLQHIDDEIERVRREMQVAGQVERERVLAEARTRRERLERDAKLLIEQELKAAREELRVDVVRGAASSARELLRRQVTGADQQRLSDEYLATLASVVQPPGGNA